MESKLIHIPSYVNYTLPSSGKQFAGPFPTGSYIQTDQDTVFGIHWHNCGSRRIDLDLSLVAAEGKIGWDAAYRSDNALFSGDMTDAPLPNGASELFYVKKGISPSLVPVNYYNYSADYPVEAKILVAKEAPRKFGANYMVDPNHIVASANISITRKQTILGFVVSVGGKTRFYFGNISVGRSISASKNPTMTHTRIFLTEFMTNAINLNEILDKAGAEITTARPKEGNDFIDLSPDNLSKTSLLDLMPSSGEPH